MEPSINADLTHAHKPPFDLTLSIFQSVGWFSDRYGVADGVDAWFGSSQSPTVVVGSIGIRVPNTVSVSGCRISDFVTYCEASASNPGGAVTCVGDLSKRLKDAGLMTGREYGKLTSAGARIAL
jgi:hypothetical protein